MVYITETVNALLVQNYETTTKIFLLFGFYMLSIFYVYFAYPNQKETKYFFLGSCRFILYCTAYFWLWMFWITTAVMIHPKVGIDNLLLFMITAYSIFFFVFSVIFISNAYFFSIYAVVKFGKIDISNSQNRWIKKNYNKFLLMRNKK